MNDLVENTEDTQINSLNIYQRINEIRKKVEYLKKDKQVQGYKVVTHDQVTGALRDFLIEYGVIVVPNEMGSVMINTDTQTGSGTPWMRYEAKYTIEFVNMDAPEETISINVSSHAMDTGDKAPGKALSYATKMAMLKLFSIETGEDDEERPEIKRTEEALTPAKLYKKSSNHMEAVIDNIDSVLAIKGYLAANDLDAAAEAWAEIQDVKTLSALSMAPTKGGCFTIDEGKKMKSDEFKGFMAVHRVENPLIGL